MLSRVSSAGNSVWMDNDGGATAVAGDDDAASWPASASRDELGLSTFKSMLEDDWYMGGAADSHNLTFHSDPPPPPQAATAALIDSSASCSPTSQPFFSSKNGLSSLLSSVCSTPFDPGFDDTPPLFNTLFSQMGIPALTPSNPGLLQQDCTTLLPLGFENSAFMNRNKVIKPLEIFPTVGAQPTLFQKRAMRQGSAGLLGFGLGRRGGEEDEFDDASFDGSGMNYDSDEGLENGKGEGSDKNGGSTLTGGDQKGKKKGLPAKNLMAERRRRKKLNDRLYMLRSVVPKISKMDRASILGDAIEYLKELLQRINDLHNELESTPSSSSLTATNSNNFHPLTPTPPTLPCRVKEELCHSLIPSPSSQTAKVEVRMREGRAVNIHMFCARKPGLLLSTMRALDSLGLDIQQAVISCFNGFALDVFRAEQGKDGPGVLPEEIKAVLLQSAGFHSM